MIIDAVGGSLVTVNDNFGPAASVLVGENNQAELVIAGGKTLSAAAAVTAGEFGTIRVENGATVETGIGVVIDGRLIAGVQGSSSGLVDSAGQLILHEAESIQVEWIPLPPNPADPASAAASKFGGIYTVAQYTGTPLGTTGTTANLDANIGTAYIKSVDYDVDLGGGILGVQVDLHPQGLGDTDLDGTVGPVDLAAFGLGWSPNATDKTWFQGDFDFNGNVDPADLAAFGLAWAPNGIAFPSDSGMGVVPEPGTVLMLLLGLAGLLIHRRRR